MKGKWIVLSLMGVWVLLFALAYQAHAGTDLTPQYTFAPPEGHVQFAPDQILVKFKGVKPLPTFGPEASAQLLASLPSSARAALREIQARILEAHPAAGVLLVQTSTRLSLGQSIESLYRSGSVEYAEPNYHVKPDVLPNDPKFGEQWALNNTGQSGGTSNADIDAPEAWHIHRYGTGVVVAVIDTGVDYTHEDLAANMWKNPKEIPGNGVDDDGNGYIDDVYGIDRYFNDSDPKDDHGHGTHCSGIIGGRGNNGIGISGVAWTAKIMALKFMSTSGGSTSDAITCMEYALAIRAREGYRMIWSNSWGGGGYSQTLYDTILAAQNAGVIFVASSGNDGQDGDLYTHYPSAYNLDNVICVGASNRADTIPTWSNYGCSSVDIFAPGNEILSSLPSNTYNSWSGTSMACPQVSGAAAVIWTKRGPTFNWRKIKGIILNGAEDGQAPPVFSRKCVTEGRLNLQKSLASAITDDPAIFSVTPYVATWGDKITLIGVNLGTTGTLTFKGISFPPASIVSWSSTKIVAKLPGTLPRGFGRLTVTNAAGTSRGACFDCEMLETIAGYTNLVHGWAASAQIGNDLWILGGGTYWGQTGLVEKYTLTSGRSVIDSAWMMPVPVTNSGAAAISGKIYVVGGLSWDAGGLYNTLQIFNPATGAWSLGANLPVKIHQPAVVAYGGKLYVFGGSGEGGILKSTYVYDPGTNSWSPKADMPMGAAYAGACLYGSNKIWVMGGFATSSFGSEQSIVQEYDPAANSWTSRPAMIKTRAAQGAVNYGTKIFCLHGAGGGTYGLKDSERCEAGVWMNDVYGSQPLYTPMAGRISDQVYSAAGYVYGSGGGYSRNVWKLTSP